MSLRLPIVGLLAVAWLIPGICGGEEPKIAAGHSMHGEAFNEGPRQRAYLMAGMPAIDFPITTANPEAQKFFNQGVGQLHGFWYFEAERSFRQVAALEANCPMAYWGLAMANIRNEKRAKAFIAKATALRDKASRREQLWIDSLAEYYREPAKENKDRRRALVRALENIVHEFPDDIEAKAFLVFQIWDNNGTLPISSNQAVDALIEQVLAKAPMHPVHHYRIHLWNSDKDSRALTSAARCGQSSPGVAHMWHMSGHTYSELKRYADAAWQQEASARVDHAHLIRDRVMPDQIHNYAHNNDWLVQDLTYIGRVNSAIDLAKNMIELPRRAAGTSSYSMGRNRLLEVLVRFELWDELLALGQTAYLEPADKTEEQVKFHKAFGIARFSKGDTAGGAAEIAALESALAKLRTERQQAGDAAEAKAREEKKPADQVAKAMADALVAFHNRIEAIERPLAELRACQALANKNVEEFRKQIALAGDVGKERLARMYAEAGDAEKALTLAREAADAAPNQVQPLANYAALLQQLGKQPEAQEQIKKLREMSASIDLQLPVFARLAPIAQALNLPADWRVAATPATDVGEHPDLASLGPFRWQPSPAPTWALSDMTGQMVSLEQFRGRPVLVVFYLGAGCPHCIEQLNALAPQAQKFTDAGISLVAISTDAVEGLKDTFAQSKMEGKFPFPIVSDQRLGTFKAYRAFDDFENQPLHGTFLIDGQGLVRWQDISYQPFTQIDFLLEESKRLLRLPVAPPTTTAAAR